MKLNYAKCRKLKTSKHTLPTGGLAITLPNGRLVAYKKKGASGAWDWIKGGKCCESFRFFGKPKKKGVDKP